ncbi:hypothetical protein D7X55_10730 [Corallococcus sp. AB049A]|uniref:Uncharacterized protein n=1 Tax=Corallococcus interemptor TaxID=2316720 RepID=A0A3A8QTX8_9BACT|nr:MULTISPECIES: hypothetical protein [Corallococcus]RKH46413.1 hypothetical protein D7Y23_23830 [Corallococcus sp. AB050B]RKH68322.1 hypothetical protein D7X96_17565 [Corallococcus interemptor]RKI69953.1 hypothetical protein D7X55_10730 [Corallococcus sp. AB049A]
MSDVDFGRAMGAHCALHPVLEATGTCARCGNFTCNACNQDGTSRYCPTCRERSGDAFPLGRETWSFSQLWDVCWPAFQREWAMLSLSVLVMLGVSLGAQLLINVGTAIGAAADSVVLTVVLSMVGLVAHQLVQGLVQLGMVRVCFDVLKGGRANVERLFSQMNKAVPYALTMTLVFVIVLVPLALLIFLSILAFVGTGLMDSFSLKSGYSYQFLDALVPFLGVMGLGFLVLVGPLTYLMLPLYLVQPELVFHDAPPSPLEVLRRSWAAARGQRLSMFAVALASGAIMLAGFFVCCVGVIPAMALVQLLTAGMYLAVRSPWDESASS